MLKDSLRNLIRFKASTVFNIIGLTVAFASFIIIMTQVNHDLKFDKHYPESEKIFELQVSDFPGKGFNPFVSRLFADRSIEISPKVENGAYILYTGEVPFYVSEKGKKEQMQETGAITSPGIYSVFGFKCLAGNFADYNAPGKIIMSHNAARRFFGNDNPIGQRMKVNHSGDLIPEEMEVVAVYEDLPKNSSIPNGILVNIGDLLMGDKSLTPFRTFLKTSSDNINELEKLIEAEAADMLYHPVKDPDHRFVRLVNIHDSYFGGADPRLPKGNTATVYSLSGVGILIILIAIVNFINFSMSMIPRKIRSINTKKVLGSGNIRLWLQQFTESAVLTTTALFLAIISVYILSYTPFAGLLSADISVSNNLSLIAAAFIIAVFTGIIATLYPALYSTSFSPALVLKGSFGLSAKGRKLRISLIGLQYFISITLIIVSLFIRVQYEWMRHYDIGVNKSNTLKISLSEELSGKRTIVENEIKKASGVNEIAFSLSDLFSNNMEWNREIRGEAETFAAQMVTPNLLSMMDIKITEGRGFFESDGQGKGVLIFNENARRRFDLTLGENIWAIGEECPIVGFCEDFNFQPLQYPVTPLALYVCGEEEASKWALSTVYIKTNSNDISTTTADIRKALLKLDPAFNNLLNIEFLDESIGNLYYKEKNLADLVTLFSLLAVLISTIGILGLIMFETQYRRKEIGIRKVFGATVAEILGMFNKLYVKIVIAGFVPAVPLAFYVIKKWQSEFAYQAPVALWIFAVALLITLIITVSAITIQSFRAAVENPACSIKAD